MIVSFSLYFGASSAAVIGALYLLKRKGKTEQLGYIYLGFILLKLLVFALLFRDFLTVIDTLEIRLRAQPLAPLFISLFVEAIAVSKFLKDSHK
ncbi:MAG: DUF6168 family protein [Flavobacteriaceae bacterium]